MASNLTAVEWLIEQLKQVYDKEGKLPLVCTFELLRQAKQIEKEQIIEAHGKKINGGFRSNGDFFQEEINGEQYYNENYNK